MLKTLLLTALLATANAAFGEESGIPDEIDLDHARALHEQARDLRSLADTDFGTTERDCYQRFLVNRCLDEARKLRLDRIREARALEIRARRIELADRQRQAAEAGLPTRAESPTGAIPAPTGAIPAPSEIGAPPVDEAAEAIRARRAAEAAQAEARAQAERAQRDAERQQARDRAEAAAAQRAEQAERDRERYDERIRKREEALSE